LNAAHFDGKTSIGGCPLQELLFGHPGHLGQFGTHVAVGDQLFIYSTVSIITCNLLSYIYTQMPIAAWFYMMSFFLATMYVTHYRDYH